MSSSGLLTSGPATFVARQPIFDRHARVQGYELLYRRTAGATTSEGVSADAATAGVVEGMFGIGLEALTHGQRAFFHVSRDLLLDRVPMLFPADRVVIELGPDVDADTPVLVACRDLREAGHTLALDDAGDDERTAALRPLVHYLKVDNLHRVAAMPAVDAGPWGERQVVVAKNVETASRFQEAVSSGYDLFQGFFLGKPALKAGRAVAAQHLAGVRLLAALQTPDLTTRELEDLIKRDPSTTYLVLRSVNSAAHALRATIDSIHDAIVLVGRDTVRRWATLWALAGFSRHTHSELLTMATVRARCCELLAASTGRDDMSSQAFMVGLCSLLDAILEQPLPELLATMPVSDTVRDALLGVDTFPGHLLECAMAYEVGDWERCVGAAARAGADPSVLPGAYAEALRWSRELQSRDPA
jgi:EAL and modified HD-GYP domain-containing signal transduction protein